MSTTESFDSTADPTSSGGREKRSFSNLIVLAQGNLRRNSCRKCAAFALQGGNRERNKKDATVTDGDADYEEEPMTTVMTLTQTCPSAALQGCYVRLHMFQTRTLTVL
jgi:hypothetical protein